MGIEKRGKTFDRNIGKIRPLTDDEQVLLITIRQEIIASGPAFVEENTKRYTAALAGEPVDGRITVAFDNEADYVRFTDATYGKGGLDATCLPLKRSVDVSADLLRDVHGKLPFRLVRQSDFHRIAQSIVNPFPFDAAGVNIA